MKDIATRALNLAQMRGATYADIRVVARDTQRLAVKNGKVEVIQQDETQGFGVRVIVNGAWGFAASSRVEMRQVEEVVARAVAIAKASALVKTHDVHLGDPISIKESYTTPIKINPFTVPLSTKIDLLLRADEAMRRVPGVKVTRAEMAFVREDKLFASTEDSLINQEIIESGCGIVALATDWNTGEVQVRSYPNSVGRHQQTRGYEFILEQKLVENAPRVRKKPLHSSPPISVPVTTRRRSSLIVPNLPCRFTNRADTPSNWIACWVAKRRTPAHRSSRRKNWVAFVTARRWSTSLPMLLYPAALAHSVSMTKVCPRSEPTSSAMAFSSAISPAARPRSNWVWGQSNGAMRADGWARPPIIRMTNINLLPGTWDVNDLIADTDDGIWMETNRSWSIDDKRLNFQFGTEIAWEIKKGKKTRLLKNATYTGITPEFWRSCDAVCNEKSWIVWGTPNCGKGQPPQVAHTGHGAAPARFRNVRVGVIK
jgi:TldD protein